LLSIIVVDAINHDLLEILRAKDRGALESMLGGTMGGGLQVKLGG
jgi:hypothetical protein